MKKTLFVLLLLFAARPMLAQTAPEGIWQGYDGEWRHVSAQLLALAEATPEEKFSWRPAPGVRSTSEVYMHIAIANFYLLSVTGPKMPPELTLEKEKSVTAKAEVINWLRRSLDAVKQAAEFAHSKSMVVLAGHGLTYRNVPAIAAIPAIVELNIGHNIIARAALVGLGRAVRDMLALL